MSIELYMVSKDSVGTMVEAYERLPRVIKIDTEEDLQPAIWLHHAPVSPMCPELANFIYGYVDTNAAGDLVYVITGNTVFRESEEINRNVMLTRNLLSRHGINLVETPAYYATIHAMLCNQQLNAHEVDDGESQVIDTRVLANYTPCALVNYNNLILGNFDDPEKGQVLEDNIIHQLRGADVVLPLADPLEPELAANDLLDNLVCFFEDGNGESVCHNTYVKYHSMVPDGIVTEFMTETVDHELMSVEDIVQRALFPLEHNCTLNEHEYEELCARFEHIFTRYTHLDLTDEEMDELFDEDEE